MFRPAALSLSTSDWVVTLSYQTPIGKNDGSVESPFENLPYQFEPPSGWRNVAAVAVCVGAAVGVAVGVEVAAGVTVVVGAAVAVAVAVAVGSGNGSRTGGRAARLTSSNVAPAAISETVSTATLRLHLPTLRAFSSASEIVCRPTARSAGTVTLE